MTIPSFLCSRMFPSFLLIFSRLSKRFTRTHAGWTRERGGIHCEWTRERGALGALQLAPPLARLVPRILFSRPGACPLATLRARAPFAPAPFARAPFFAFTVCVFSSARMACKQMWCSKRCHACLAPRDTHVFYGHKRCLFTHWLFMDTHAAYAWPIPAMA